MATSLDVTPGGTNGEPHATKHDVVCVVELVINLAPIHTSDNGDRRHKISMFAFTTSCGKCVIDGYVLHLVRPDEEGARCRAPAHVIVAAALHRNA